jgi:hypothetical protein
MKTLQKIIALSLLSFTLSTASQLDTKVNYTYSSLSTTELEKQVEILSKSGELPFEMGIELMKRWSHKA